MCVCGRSGIVFIQWTSHNVKCDALSIFRGRGIEVKYDLFPAFLRFSLMHYILFCRVIANDAITSDKPIAEYNCTE